MAGHLGDGGTRAQSPEIVFFTRDQKRDNVVIMLAGWALAHRITNKTNGIARFPGRAGLFPLHGCIPAEDSL